ncbi:MAG: hypothetical protein GTN49_05735 [candidate division Zixibacteria bacterium]|nr:hypothetical protein [candidate division Zixibacteria bacterium]
MKKLTVVAVLTIPVAPAAAITPFVNGGLDDIAPGAWTFFEQKGEKLVPAYYGSTFYLGGGFSHDIAKFRQKRIIPTLSLDTYGGFTRFRSEWRTGDLEGWEQTFYQLTAVEALVLRIRIPAGSRLITPFVGIGGGFAVVPTSIDKLEGFPGAGEEGFYEDSQTAFNLAYAVPFGLELTLSPSRTIFWLFGPVAPVGRVTYEYKNIRGNTEKVEAEVPNSFLVTFGYKWGL